MSIAASKLVAPSTDHNGVDASSPALDRQAPDYHATVWKDFFLQFASQSLELDEEMRKEVEILKEEVRKMLVPTSDQKPLISKAKLIDSIQRLGLEYHFESEIDQVLQKIHEHYVEDANITHNQYDLNSLALLFRLLRQQGYPISSDVFNKFKDEEGKFSEEMTKDVEGMLSLYEAAHLSIHGEDILDEALAFTSTHLLQYSITNNNNIQSNPFLEARVHHSLKQLPYRGLPRLEARKYISIYHQDPSHHELLLILAKLDFNMLQKLHQKEFGNICKWWISTLDAPRNFPYSRDRIVECCFWILTVYFEPKYSQARRILTKVISLLSIIDDTYDAFGTVDELEHLTNALQSWDISRLDDLPECLKLVYKELFNSFEEAEQEVSKEGRAYSIHYTKEELKKVLEAYLSEARWSKRKYVPTTEEYIRVSTVSCCYPMLSTTSFIGMGHIASEDVFKWAQTHPKIFMAAAKVCRMMDDIVSNEFEQKREHVVSALECYMKEKGVSREEAIDELGGRIKNAWKDINEEFLKPTKVPNPILMRVLNLTRFIDVMYKDKDNYTHAQGLMKNAIASSLLHPIPM